MSTFYYLLSYDSKYIHCFLDFKDAIGPKGKCPWITDEDGKAVADTHFIIEHLTKKHNLQELELTPQEAAVARGMRAILEDNLV